MEAGVVVVMSAVLERLRFKQLCCSLEALNSLHPPHTTNHFKTGSDQVFVPEFAAHLEKEKIIFVGPNSFAINALGDKINSKELAVKAKVNTIPGYKGEIKVSDGFTDYKSALFYRCCWMMFFFFGGCGSLREFGEGNWVSRDGKSICRWRWQGNADRQERCGSARWLQTFPTRSQVKFR